MGVYKLQAHPKARGRPEGMSPKVLPPQKNSSKQEIRADFVTSEHLMTLFPASGVKLWIVGARLWFGWAGADLRGLNTYRFY